MFVENQNNEGAEQASQQEEIQQQENPFSDVNPDFVEVAEEDDGFIDADFGENSFYDEDIQRHEETQQAQAEQQQESQEENNEDPNALNFDEVEAKGEEEDLEVDEALIEKLKAKGFDVTKKEEAPANSERNDLLQKYDNDIASANAFLALPDEQIIKEKLTTDLASAYRNSGKEHLINTEEFEIELEAEIESITENHAVKKLYVDNFKNDVKGYLNQIQNKKGAIVKEIEQENQNKIQTNRQNLQNYFKQVNQEGFLGLKVDKEVLEKSYKSIVNGEMTNKINKDPNLVAKFALFIEQEEKLQETLSKPTYGEGVKDVYETLAGKSDNKSRSPLGHSLNNRSNNSGAEVKDTIRRFLPKDEVIKEANKQENMKIAGAPRY